MKILILVVMFLCIGAFFIISQENLRLNTSENVDKVISLYRVWLSSSLENVGSLVGNVVKMEWLPK